MEYIQRSLIDAQCTVNARYRVRFNQLFDLVRSTYRKHWPSLGKLEGRNATCSTAQKVPLRIFRKSIGTEINDLIFHAHRKNIWLCVETRKFVIRHNG